MHTLTKNKFPFLLSIYNCVFFMRGGRAVILLFSLSFLFKALALWADAFYKLKCPYEGVQPVGLISLSCNWVILHNEIDQM